MKTPPDAGVEMPADLKPVYLIWLDRHFRQAKGEWKRRLEQHGHAEQLFVSNVWWPAFRKLDGLIPEYEAKDFRDGWRYLDFAYMTNGFKICIEIDGFAPHVRDLDRGKHSDHLMRQNYLIIDGWIMMRFSYDDVKGHPRRCQQVLQQLFGVLAADSEPAYARKLTPIERAIVKQAKLQQGPITTKDVSMAFEMGRDTALRYIRLLVDKDVLVPIRPGARHIRGYKLNPTSTYLRDWC